jgi:hypothetical protein
MRRLRILGLMLMAVFALGAVAAASASALEKEEAGLLTLTALTEPLVFENSEGGAGVLNVGAEGKAINCTGIKVLGSLGAASQTHVTLGTADLHFTGCKRKELTCKSSTDEKEIILASVDVHLINVLSAEKKLQPGVAFTPKENIVITCGTAIVEVKQTLKCLIVKASLTEEVKHFGVDCKPAGEICDPNLEPSAKECKELDAKPFLGKVKKEFESANIEQEALVLIPKLVLIDD